MTLANPLIMLAISRHTHIHTVNRQRLQVPSGERVDRGNDWQADGDRRVGGAMARVIGRIDPA